MSSGVRYISLMTDEKGMKLGISDPPEADLEPPWAKPEKHIEIGEFLCRLSPTSHLRFKEGILYQWWEARVLNEDGGSSWRGEWQRVDCE